MLFRSVGIICARFESQSTMTRRALYPWLIGNSMIRSTDMTCHLWSGIRLGRSLPIGEAGKVFFFFFLNPGFSSFGAKPYVRREIQVFSGIFVLSALCFSISASAPWARPWACLCLLERGGVCLIAFVSCLVAPSCPLSFPSFTQSLPVYLLRLVVGHFRSCA